MESEVSISITCKGLWSPKSTGDEKNLVAEVKELLSELLCLEKVEIVSGRTEGAQKIYPGVDLKLSSKKDAKTQSEDETELPEFVNYRLETEKGKELQEMMLILRSLGATEDLLLKVVQANCGVPLSSLQPACL